MLAKSAAWVICIIAAMGCAVMGICVLVGIMDSSMINSTRSEMLKDGYESVNVDYSIDRIQAASILSVGLSSQTVSRTSIFMIRLRIWKRI